MPFTEVLYQNTSYKSELPASVAFKIQNCYDYPCLSHYIIALRLPKTSNQGAQATV